jgi:hypothetical protein
MNLFWLQVRPFLSRCRAVLSWLGILGGAAGVLVGTLSPWATFRVFHNIEINLPGIVFLWGGLCLAVAALIFLGMRRSSLLCLVGAFFVLHWTGEASKRVPERVKFQLAGSQLALETSVNRLLDQFHIPDIEIANLSTPNPDLLGAGLGWTTNGAYWLLAGSLLGLPGDPVVVWVYTRTARLRCRACGTRRPVSRAAKFCPHCGVSTLPAHLRPCPHCGNPARRGDFHCVTCGTALAEMT